MCNYNPDLYKYGYLNELCGCGDPIGMKGGSNEPFYNLNRCYRCDCKAQYTPGADNKEDVCKLCGLVTFYQRIHHGMCGNCPMLNNRGVEEHPGDSIKNVGDFILINRACIYCSSLVCSLNAPNVKLTDGYNICNGCKIEPLTANLKPCKH